MSTINVIVIPADKEQPVRRDTYDSSDYKNLTALIFSGDRDGTFDRMASIDEHGEEVTLWFDDEGLYRLKDEGGEHELADIINLRAMQLYAFLEHADIHSFSVPLLGDYVITGGADEEGESLPAPDWIMDFRFDWHNRYEVRKVGE